METRDTGAAERIAAAKAAARRPGKRGRGDDPDALHRSPLFWIIIITLTILFLSGLIVWHGLRNPPPPPTPLPAGVTDIGGKQSGVTVGGTDGPIVEVYFDLMCPQCRALDAQTGALLDELMTTNRIQLVWHPLALLDDATRPGGYSTRAANALACAADAGKLRDFASVLFANQPAPGSAGLTDDQLIDVAGPVGLIQPSFAACVRDQRYRDWLAIGNAAAARREVRAPAVFVDDTPLARPTAEAILSAIG